jgi:hypothetical protein
MPHIINYPHRRGSWQAVDDGIISGHLLRRLTACGVCGRATACVQVKRYDFPAEVPWHITIIAKPVEPYGPEGKWNVAACHLVGVGCGCYAKLHRQVTHIQRSDRRVNDRSPG